MIPVSTQRIIIICIALPGIGGQLMCHVDVQCAKGSHAQSNGARSPASGDIGSAASFGRSPAAVLMMADVLKRRTGLWLIAFLLTCMPPPTRATDPLTLAAFARWVSDFQPIIVGELSTHHTVSYLLRIRVAELERAASAAATCPKYQSRNKLAASRPRQARR